MMKDLNTRLVDLTLGEAFEILRPQLVDVFAEALVKAGTPMKKDVEYGYGIRAIQELLHCCPAKANKVKSSGVLNPAITQNGRTIVIDMEYARRLLKEASWI